MLYFLTLFEHLFSKTGTETSGVKLSVDFKTSLGLGSDPDHLQGLEPLVHILQLKKSYTTLLEPAGDKVKVD